MMSPGRERRALELFERALDLAPAERAALLDAECAGDDVLRARVDALIAADAAGHSPLDRDPESLLDLLDESGAAAGEHVGPYRIVRELGRGGMGVVFLAERDDDEFTRRVALKVIRPGPDADLLSERFVRERQILADLRHPNIAQLYDGGRTAAGLPYLAMEYVEGRPIDAWCRERGLSVEERLRLFRGACDAVQHAHQNLIVHRDLKPAHVLVTESGEIKLLDFGIARLLDADARPGDTVHAFTPRYASPEQLRHEPVTTATDVWALGVMLYEVLSDRSPFEGAAEGWDLARAVMETEPRPVSTAAEPGRARALRGDLDAIVRTALRRDPAERYATAAALRDDIDRHLRSEPVRARPETARYRFAKFARRHRMPLAGAAVLLVAALAGGAAYTRGITRARARAELEARKAGEVRDFLVDLFNSNLPTESLGDTLRVRDLLERGVARADSLEDQPELRALLLTTLGDVYRVLGRYDRAQRLLSDAVALYDAHPEANRLDRAGALVSMAMLHYDLDEYEEALPPTREALEIQRAELGEDDPLVLSSLNNLATLTSHTGDVAAALDAYEALLARRRRVLGPEDPAVALTLNNIGMMHYRSERYADAEKAFRESLELRRRTLPAAHPDVMFSLNNLASTVQELGRLDEAERLMREALELRRQVYGDAHPRVAVSHYNLGRLLQRRGSFDEAETHLRAALDIDRATYGADHSEVGADSYQLGTMLAEAGRCADALGAFAEAERIFRAQGDAAADRLERTRAAAAECRARLGADDAGG